MSEVFLTPKKGTNIHKCCKALVAFYTSMNWEFVGNGAGVCFESKCDLSVMFYIDSDDVFCGIDITGSDEQICFYIDETLGGLNHIKKHFEVEDIYNSLYLCDISHEPSFVLWKLPELEKQLEMCKESIQKSINPFEKKEMTQAQKAEIKSIRDEIRKYHYQIPAMANHESCRNILPDSKTNGVAKIKATFGVKNG